MKNVIEIKNLTKSYGKNRGVENVNLTVGEGEIFGFLGPNGAGKSTTIRSILGLIQFTQGEAKILGMDIRKNQKEIMRQIGYMPSEAMFYPQMKVSEVIRLAAETRGMDCSAEAAKICDRMEVDTKKKIEELSLGNRKKVSIVCAMQHRPKLFLFDEPTSGLDPLMQEAFFKLIMEYHKEGTTCFLSSHVLSEVKKYCQKAAIIKEGKIVTVDTVENLTKSNIRNIRIQGLSEVPKLSGVLNPTQNGEEISFTYKGEIQALIQALEKENIKDLLILEPTLDEVFMHYYSN